MRIREDMPESLSDLLLFYGAVGVGALIGLYVYAVYLT
jgi:hypothetical protein